MIDRTILQNEEADRAVFEQRIADGERRLTEQMLRIERRRAQGQDVASSEQLLQAFGMHLEEWRSTMGDIEKVIQSYELLERSRELVPPTGLQGPVV